MRQITEQSTTAFSNHKNFNKSNTSVIVEDHVTKLVLFGHTIAYKYPENDKVEITNCGYFTNTTKERLNGIDGVNIYQRNGVWYLNENEWNGELIEIN